MRIAQVGPELVGRAWRPLGGFDLLDRLRATGRRRLRVNPELVACLRSSIEDDFERANTTNPSPGTDQVSPQSPLLVTKDRLTRALACEAHHVVSEFGERRLTVAMACGVLVDALFRQLVTVGAINDPMVDGTDALASDVQQRPLLLWIESLPPAERRELEVEVVRQAKALVARWPKLDPGWLPRTQEPIRCALSGGSLLLTARVDLAVGSPAGDESSIAMVEIKSGRRRAEHRADLHFYALLETLRSGAPPFVVATYYTRTGELDVDPMTEELLVDAARRTRAAMGVLVELAQGVSPRRIPNGLCGACSALPECKPRSSCLDSRGPGLEVAGSTGLSER
ncbi:MAG: PD-(D/E)XK nuclease family protein [Acidimicrobiales bacterium]